MSKRSHLTVKVFSMAAGNVSYYGNPSLILHTDHGTFNTLADAGFVYGAWNNGGYAGKKVELSLTPGGRVTNVRVLRTDKLALVG